jgi:hypothetical protein
MVGCAAHWRPIAPQNQVGPRRCAMRDLRRQLGTHRRAASRAGAWASCRVRRGGSGASPGEPVGRAGREARHPHRQIGRPVAAPRSTDVSGGSSGAPPLGRRGPSPGAVESPEALVRCHRHGRIGRPSPRAIFRRRCCASGSRAGRPAIRAGVPDGLTSAPRARPTQSRCVPPAA